MYAYKQRPMKENTSAKKVQKHPIIQKCAIIQRMENVPGEHYASPDKVGNVDVELCDLSLVVSSNPGIADMVLGRPEATEALRKMMEEGKEVPPIALNYTDYSIRDGRHRTQAALKLEYTKIPCYYTTDMGVPMDLPKEE